MKIICNLVEYTALVRNCIRSKAYQGECANCVLNGLCEVEQNDGIQDMANMVELEEEKHDGD